VTLALLTGLAVLMFLAVTGLSHLYQAQQQSLAERWSSRGLSDLDAQRFSTAVSEFRAALRYSRDSYSYQLGLAQALLGLNRSDEADAYLINLWDRQPENGLVNLELARIAAHKGQPSSALRYYHDAIYAIWPGDQEAASHNARLELINYLLKINSLQQAQAELIVLAANIGEDSPEQKHLGELFLRAQESQRALVAFQSDLRRHPHDEATLAGAGTAAYQLGLYPDAQGYLHAALQITPGDTKSAEWLRKTNLVLNVDPYTKRIPAAERSQRVINAFSVAGERLKTCSARGAAATSATQDLARQWTKMKPQITDRNLRLNPDLLTSAMDLAVGIERNTNGACGPLSEQDDALLLMANLHEGN
jgi:tetratricopeptide (TPR) repeat protein